MPFKISKVLSKRINYMHVQWQQQQQQPRKWVTTVEAPKQGPLQQQGVVQGTACKLCAALLIHMCACVCLR